MSTEQVPSTLPFVGGKKPNVAASVQHPLGPLTAAEIKQSATIIKGLWPEKTNIQFKSITLREPNKSDLVPFLAAAREGRRTPTVERRSFIVYYIRNTVCTPNI